MLNFVGLIGTNSKESNNRRLLQFMQKHFADKASIELVEIDNIPLFNKPAKMKSLLLYLLHQSQLVSTLSSPHH